MPIRTYLTWWLEQLAGLVPARWLQVAAHGPDASILALDHEDVTLLIRRRGETVRSAHDRFDEEGLLAIARTLAASPGLPPRLLLRVPGSMILQKRLSLPLAARNGLAGLLSFEMARETPFSSDEVYWQYVVHSQDPTHGRLDVDLILLPRALIDPFIERARHAGLDPAGIEVEIASDDVRVIPLAAPKPWQQVYMQRPFVAAAAAAALVILAIAIPFIVQMIALAGVQSTIASLGPEATEATKLLQTVDQLSSTTNFLHSERQKNGSALAALAAATTALPDDTYLTGFTLHAARLTITGRSPAAAQLIEPLSKPPFRSPHFNGAVQSEGDVETFAITVEMIPAGPS